MDSRHRVAIRFRDRAAFGRCCMALNQDEVPFSLAGSYTVVLRETAYQAWLEKAPRQVKEDLSALMVQVIGRGSKRAALPSEKQTDELLWKLSKAR
jgi:hypothetical protein